MDERHDALPWRTAVNVLLTSAGRRVSLVRAFRSELKELHPYSKVLAADVSSWSSAFRAADEGVLLPPCHHPEYVSALLDVVHRHDVRVVIPLLDPELLVMAQHRAAFTAAGCEVIISDAGTVRTTRDKGASVRRFQELGFRTPRVFELEEIRDSERLPYPVFVKPAAGSSSIDARRVDDADDLRYWMRRIQAPVVQTFETGQEYTIDVFADRDGKARCAVPRQRWEVRAGEISKGRTVKDPKLMAAAMRLVEGLGGCRGCITLQCFDRGGAEPPVFFEANLRFGGGFPLSYAAGANYPRWVLEMCAGKRILPFDGWRDGVVMLRYDDAVYVQEDG
jgi:carbamoyl-phosphate synthase large subunit